jgi:hypothetical protein
MRRPGIVLGLSMVLTALAACSAAPRQPRYFAMQGAAQQPVNLQLWCDTLSETYCERCNSAHALRCRDEFMPACLGGRNPGLLTMNTGYDLQICNDALETVDCGAVATGQLPHACRVNH